MNEEAPDVYSIVRAGSVLRPVTEATFDVAITLSEEPRKDGFKKDQIDVSNATAADPVLIRKYTDDTFAEDGVAIVENPSTTDNLVETGRDNMIYEYVVTITPKFENKNDIVVKVKSFMDQEKPVWEGIYATSTCKWLYRRRGQAHRQGRQRGPEGQDCRY